MKQSLGEQLHTAAGTARRAVKVFQKKGLSGVAQKIRGRLRRRTERARFDRYADWIAANEPAIAELERQRAKAADWIAAGTSAAAESERQRAEAEQRAEAPSGQGTTSAPLVSILVPVYRTRPLFLRQLLQSVLEQTYPNWELILADGSAWPAGSDEEKQWQMLLAEPLFADPRIRLIDLKENAGITGNTNAAYSEAKGTIIAFLDHDDTISPDALYRVVSAWRADPSREVFYSDVDNLSEDGSERLAPHFKPDFSWPMLCSMNYLCHFLVITRELVERVQGADGGPAGPLLHTGFEGAQDYDLILRCCEQAKGVCHIPRVLYHWRAYGDSTAENPDSKRYAFEAGMRAVQAHYDRMHLPGTVETTFVYGTYQTRWELPEKTKLAEDEVAEDEVAEDEVAEDEFKEAPLISVLIPNRDQSEALSRCLHSLTASQVYQNLEILILENGSADSKTAACYERWQDADPRIRVLQWPGTEFNYSAINNFGAAQAHGTWLLLLNNDTELESSLHIPGLEELEADGQGETIWQAKPIRQTAGRARQNESPDHQDAVTILLTTAIYEKAAAVGARLLYPDDTIQHAGIILGLGGVAGHPFAGADLMDPGYFNRIIACQELSAVTGACMLVRKDAWEAVGGMNEQLAVTFNDVDFCLRLRQIGERVLYNPRATLYHYESKSRGAEDTSEKRRRFGSEIETFLETWETCLAAGDPYYNPNLSLEDGGYGLAGTSRIEKS